MDQPTLEPLNLHSSPGEVEEWVERFELWSSIRKDVKPENKSTFFLTFGGRELYSLLKNLSYPRAPASLPFQDLKTLLLKHVMPVNFRATERAKFNTLVRNPNTSCREFILILQKQAAKCEFGDLLEDNLRDRLIAGINNVDLQRKMLMKPDLTYAEAREICEQRDDVTAATTEQGAVFFQKCSPKSKQSRHRYQANKTSENQAPKKTVKPINKCMSCGDLHLRSTCRFRNAVCHGCGKSGHIKKVCRSKQCNLTQPNPVISQQDESSTYVLQLKSPAQQFIYKSLQFDSNEIAEFIVDTGSSESVIPVELLNRVAPEVNVQPTNVQLRGVTGHNLPLTGETILFVKQDNQISVPVRFLVSRSSPAILGLKALRALKYPVSLNIVPVENSGEQLQSSLRKLIVQCSTNTGGMNVEPAKLEAEGDPIFLKRRILPYGVRDGVFNTLKKLESTGIISPVSSSAWATPIVVALKSDGKTPRICGDYRLTLNPRLKRCAATTEEPEDFMRAIHGSKIFSKIDLANAYLQIPLEEKSKPLTTINTPWGLFQFNFLPFGLHVSSGIFQAAIDKVIQGLPGVQAYQDDLIIYGRTLEEHDQRLLALMQRLAAKNVSIKPSKCVFRVNELQFLGYVIDSKGYRPDPARYDALANVQSPTDQCKLRSIMGCLQYYSRFIPNFASRAQPLFLAQHAEKWEWNDQLESVLRTLIQAIVDRPVLVAFSPIKPTTLITDASDVGIGAVLEQEGFPIICISRLLNKAERGYSQTQKEALAIFWAVKRLHKYLFGLRFQIVTDHQALQFLFNPKKSLAKTTASMVQRWSIYLAAYDYEIVHRAGKDIPQADFLSRYAKLSPAEACCLTSQACAISREQLRMSTKKYYSPVLSAIKNGWRPDVRKKYLRLYQVRDELLIQPDGVICRGDRLLIPPTLRKPVLDDLHKGHMGIEKMKSLARQEVWWPEIDADIRNTAMNCEACLHKINSRPKNWTPWPDSYLPWQRVHVDYCGPFLGKYFALVIIDSYSKWPEVFLTTTPTTAFTMQALRKCFSREGIPQVLITDNGAQLCSNEMKEWLDSIGCRHLRTAPRHPCSNGAAENLVKTLKSAIHSANPGSYQALDQFIDNFLLQYRNAVHSTTKESPAKLFKSRTLRTSLHRMDSSDVTYFRGNDLRPAHGIITRQIGSSMMEITDLQDASVHQRHKSQVQFKNSVEENISQELPHQPESSMKPQTESNTLRRSARLANRSHARISREEGCDVVQQILPTTNQSEPATNQCEAAGNVKVTL